MGRIIDISRPIREGLPVWPGDPAVEIARSGEAGLPSVSRLSLGTHTGTHVDPPAHFFAGGNTVDRLPPEVLIGPAWLAHLPGPGPIRAPALADAGIPEGTVRLLLRTMNSESAADVFDPEFVGLGPDAAAWLLDLGVQLIGIDGPSIEPYDADAEQVHRMLLAAGVVIVEGLVLSGIASGPYTLVCLPLAIENGDGAPARAVLISEP